MVVPLTLPGTSDNLRRQYAKLVVSLLLVWEERDGTAHALASAMVERSQILFRDSECDQTGSI